MPFFFFDEGVVTKNIDLILLNLLQGFKAKTSYNIRVIMRSYRDGTRRNISAFKIGQASIHLHFFFQCTVTVLHFEFHCALTFNTNQVILTK